jgi:hypothetical protein
MAATRPRDSEFLQESRRVRCPPGSREVLSKKRKFSPIIWDRDEMKQPDISSNRTGKTWEELSVVETLAPLAPLTEPSSFLAVSP